MTFEETQAYMLANNNDLDDQEWTMVRQEVKKISRKEYTQIVINYYKDPEEFMKLVERQKKRWSL